MVTFTAWGGAIAFSTLTVTPCVVLAHDPGPDAVRVTWPPLATASACVAQAAEVKYGVPGMGLPAADVWTVRTAMTVVAPFSYANSSARTSVRGVAMLSGSGNPNV